MIKKTKILLSFLLCTAIILGISELSFTEQGQEVSLIAFSRYTSTNWQIWVRNLETREEHQLTSSPIDKRSPQWGLGGKNIFYRTANSEIYIFDIGNKIEEKILQRFGAIMDQRWSKDAKTITFARLRPDLLDDSDIWISDLSGKNALPLTNEVGLQYYPVFSPDAKQIAFVSSNKEGGQTIYIMDSDGKNKRELTGGKFFDVLPSFSPDGKYIVFSSNRSSDYEIWQLEVATGKIRQLTHSQGIDTSPVFSPDGENIAFVSSQSGALQIWSMDKDGNNLAMLTQDNNAPAQDPAWITLPESLWQALIRGASQ